MRDIRKNVFMIVFQETMVATMTNDELLEVLKPVAIGLQNPLTSKQHVFNSNMSVIERCKVNGISNKKIVEAINHHLKTEEHLTLIYFKNMLNRAKSKSLIKTVTNDTKKFDAQTESAKSPSVDDDLLSTYLKVCFNKKLIAQKAIEHDVSIETIKSWKCPNFVQLNNTLGNYIRNR